MIQNDTIVALASPSGSGAIAVIRVSGLDAISVAYTTLSLKSSNLLKDSIFCY
jgi:tRNA U34 5-carboxymethylaminomethyl modifying GTPase MnmE/TrmE